MKKRRKAQLSAISGSPGPEENVTSDSVKLVRSHVSTQHVAQAKQVSGLYYGRFGRTPAPASHAVLAESLSNSLVKNDSTPEALEESELFYMEKLERKKVAPSTPLLEPYQTNPITHRKKKTC